MPRNRVKKREILRKGEKEGKERDHKTDIKM